MFVNGIKRGFLYSDSQQPNADYVSSWFSSNPDGEIFKIDDWFEFDDTVKNELKSESDPKVIQDKLNLLLEEIQITPLHSLRLQLGDDDFWRGVNRYLERHSGGAAKNSSRRRNRDHN